MFVILHAGLTRDWLERVEASAITETSETDKKKRKKKRKGSKLSNEQANSDKSSSETLVTSKDNEPLKTDRDGPSKTGNDGGSAGGKATHKKTESSETSKSDSDVSDNKREASNDSGKSSERAKLSKTGAKGKDYPKEQCAESAAGKPPLKTSDSLKALSESKGTSAMKQKTVKKPVSKESGGEEEVEPVAKEVGEVAKDVSTGGDGGAAAAAARKKLHTCGLCGREEVTAKTFKRCQK